MSAAPDENPEEVNIRVNIKNGFNNFLYFPIMLYQEFRNEFKLTIKTMESKSDFDKIRA